MGYLQQSWVGPNWFRKISKNTDRAYFDPVFSGSLLPHGAILLLPHVQLYPNWNWSKIKRQFYDNFYFLSKHFCFALRQLLVFRRYIFFIIYYIAFIVCREWEGWSSVNTANINPLLYKRNTFVYDTAHIIAICRIHTPACKFCYVTVYLTCILLKDAKCTCQLIYSTVIAPL